jgi:hypothetical protein
MSAAGVSPVSEPAEGVSAYKKSTP